MHPRRPPLIVLAEGKGMPAILLALLGLCNLFAVSAWPLRWVKVDYQDEQGQQRTAYFTVASVTGRWAGGGRRADDMSQLRGMVPGEVVTASLDKVEPHRVGEHRPAAVA